MDRVCINIQGDGVMQTQKIFVVDTNCLLLSCNLIFDICHKNGFKITLPQIVIDELDRLKDNKGYKENRNAHRAIQAINSYQCEIYKKRLNGKKPDEQIRQCASESNAYIISEDKTFKTLYKQTLTIKEFKEQFATYLDDIPNLATEQLFNAIQKRDINKVKTLLKESELKINAYDNKGLTPLIYAIKKRDLEIVNLLCEYKDIDMHKCDKSHLKMTPLAYTVQDDNVEMVILLLKHKACAYVGNMGKNKSNTPFLMACWDNRKNAIAIMALLLDSGISINQVDGNGFSGLIKACIKGHSNIVRWLLAKGADSHIRDFEGRDALTHAKSNKHNKIVAMLEDYNVK